jgi:hypothetical protein
LIVGIRESKKEAAEAAANLERKRREDAQARRKAAEDLQRVVATSANDQRQAADLFEMLPSDLERALARVEDARGHVRAGAYSPFWESIEQGYNCLGAYLQRLEQIRQFANQHAGHQKTYSQLGGSGLLPRFPIDAEKIAPSRAALGVDRVLQREAYEAQKDPVYAQIWEQRRNTAAVIQGFNTLSEAMSNMQAAIAAQISGLQTSLAGSMTALQAEVRSGNVQLSQVAASNDQLVGQAVLLNSQVANSATRLKRIERSLAA